MGEEVVILNKWAVAIPKIQCLIYSLLVTWIIFWSLRTISKRDPFPVYIEVSEFFHGDIDPLHEIHTKMDKNPEVAFYKILIQKEILKEYPLLEMLWVYYYLGFAIVWSVFFNNIEKYSIHKMINEWFLLVLPKIRKLLLEADPSTILQYGIFAAISIPILFICMMCVIVSWKLVLQTASDLIH